MSKFNFLFFVCLFILACKSDVKTSPNEDQEIISNENNNVAGQSTTDLSNSNSSIPPADNIILNNGENASNTTNTSTITSSQSRIDQANTENQPQTIKFGEAKKSETYTTIIPDQPVGKNGKRNLPIPDPASLISSATIKSIFKLSGAPEIKQGSKPKPNDRSTFFRFDDPGKPNGGIMLQILTNPMPEEIDDYPALVIDSKIKDGEMTPYDKTPKKFTPWNELGNGGCYSYEAGKYHWKIDDRYIFMLAFNTSQTEAQQKAAASQIGREVMDNFAKSLR
jgi:hypothetical protein